MPLQNRSSQWPAVFINILLIWMLHGTAAQADAYGPVKPVRMNVPVSKIKQKADAMLAKTRAGYYKKFLVTNRKSNLFSSERTSADPCSGTLCRPTSPLPVTLIRFSGKRVDKAQVLLDWTTSSEVNNDFFEVQRSLNPANGFEIAGVKKGSGSSSQQIAYQFTDPNTETGYTYYRLRQVDLDGSFTYSQIIGIKGYSETLSVTAFPNPGFQKDLAFQVAGTLPEESISIQISDVRGVILYQKQDYILKDNRRIVLPAFPGMKAGSYYMHITGKGNDAGTTFVIISD